MYVFGRSFIISDFKDNDSDLYWFAGDNNCCSNSILLNLCIPEKLFKIATFTSITDVHNKEIRSYNMSRIKGKIYKEINFYQQANLLLLV